MTSSSSSSSSSSSDCSLQWAAGLRGCPQRVNHAAVLLGTHVYSFGGFSSSRARRLSQRRRIDVLRLHVHTLRWRDITLECSVTIGNEFPRVRYGHTAVSHRARAFVFGGRNDYGVEAPFVFEFDPNCCRWRVHSGEGHVPERRDGHSACVVGAAMLVFGGFTESEEFDDQVYSCNLDTMQWTRLQPRSTSPLARDFCCCVAWGNGFYMWGGRSDEAGLIHTGHPRYDSRLHYFDADTCRWCAIAAGPMPDGRRSGVMFRLLDNLYFGYGYTDYQNANRHFGDLWQLEPSSGRVRPARPSEPLCSGPCPRRRLVALPIGRSRAILFGGTCSVYAFRPSIDAVSFRRLYAPVMAALPAFGGRASDGDADGDCRRREAEAVGKGEGEGGDGDGQDAGRVESEEAPASREDFLRELEEPEDSSLGLKDLSDMFLLEAEPSLQSLCLAAVIRCRLPLGGLHALLQQEIVARVADNSITPID